MRLGIALLLILPGCGQPVYKVHSELAPYVQSFSAEGNVEIVALVARFKPLPPTVVGHCSSENGSPLIEIDRQYWDRVGHARREMLVYHELGHCILGREHSKRLEYAPKRRPASVMYPYALSEKVYSEYRNEYIKELFK